MFYNTALGNCYYLPKRVSLFLFYGGFECKENLAINPFNKGFYVNPEKLIQFFFRNTVFRVMGQTVLLENSSRRSVSRHGIRQILLFD